MDNNTIISFKDNEQIKKCVESDRLNLSSRDKAKLILYIGKKEYAEECIRNKDLGLIQQDIMLLKVCYEIGLDENKNTIEEKTIMLKTPKGSTKGIEIESGGNIKYDRQYEKNIDLKLAEVADERKWGCSRDGSGIEFSSYIMEDDEQATKSIYYICTMLKEQNHKVTDIDGGHIHVGTNILTNVQSYKNLLEIWYNLEKAMFLVSNQENELPRLSAIYDELYAEPKSKKLNELIQTGEIELTNDDDINCSIKVVFR